MNNKKVLGISIAAVVVLVVAIIATSYATFTANLTGTKDNTIKTGYVTMNCTESRMTLANTQPMTDSQGIGASNNVTTCELSVTMNGSMTIGYDVGFASVTPSASLTTSGVKFQAYKQIGNNTTATKSYEAGTASTGVTFASIASAVGTYVPTGTNGITSYAFSHGEVSATQKIYYTIHTWVASEGSGSTSNSSTSTAACSNSTYTTKETCEGANAVWGTSQTVEQAGGTFSFKLKIASTQI